MAWFCSGDRRRCRWRRRCVARSAHPLREQGQADQRDATSRRGSSSGLSWPSAWACANFARASCGICGAIVVNNNLAQRAAFAQHFAHPQRPAATDATRRSRTCRARIRRQSGRVTALHRVAIRARLNTGIRRSSITAVAVAPCRRSSSARTPGTRCFAERSRAAVAATPWRAKQETATSSTRARRSGAIARRATAAAAACDPAWLRRLPAFRRLPALSGLAFPGGIWRATASWREILIH